MFTKLNALGESVWDFDAIKLTCAAVLRAACLLTAGYRSWKQVISRRRLETIQSRAKDIELKTGDEDGSVSSPNTDDEMKDVDTEALMKSAESEQEIWVKFWTVTGFSTFLADIMPYGIELRVGILFIMLIPIHGQRVTEYLYQSFLAPSLNHLELVAWPYLKQYVAQLQTIASSSVRHIRRAGQSFTIDGIDEAELLSVESDLRSVISLVQQERRKRTVAEFLASRDALSNAIPASSTPVISEEPEAPAALTVRRGSGSKSLKASPANAKDKRRRKTTNKSSDDSDVAFDSSASGSADVTRVQASSFERRTPSCESEISEEAWREARRTVVSSSDAPPTILAPTRPPRPEDPKPVHSRKKKSGIMSRISRATIGAISAKKRRELSRDMEKLSSDSD